MTYALQRRLPGVRFDVPAPTLDEALPRMDIAFFVGFAACGPLNVPVAVESLAEFENVFGSEITLLSAPDGSAVRGLLHASMRQFFSHGGRRAWVQRVAGDHAQTTRFPLQHALVLHRPMAKTGTAPGPWRAEPAWVAARCPGSWADGLTVFTHFEAKALAVRPVAFDGLQLSLLAAGPLALALAVGDVLRVALATGEWVQGRVTTAGAASTNVATAQLQRPLVLAGLASLRASPDEAFATRVAWTEPTVGGDGTIEHRAHASGKLEAGRVALQCMLPARARLALGEVVHVSFAGSHGTAWVALDEVELTAIGNADGQVHARLAGVAWRVPVSLARPPIEAWVAAEQTGSAQWLRAGLAAAQAGVVDARIEGLALVPRNDGTPSLLDLPDDARYYAELTQRPATRAAQAFELTRRSSHQTARFPLASAPFDGELMILPLAAGPGLASGLGARGIALLPLRRDGLDQFAWQLFAEPALAGFHADALADQAEAMRLLGKTPRALRGMHALFGTAVDGPVEEPTLLAIPDAVQPGWVRKRRRKAARQIHTVPLPPAAAPCGWFRDCALRDLPRPVFQPEADPDGAGNFGLSWLVPASSPPFEELGFELQEAADIDFTIAGTAYAGPESRFAVTGKPRGTLFYRVRSVEGARTGAWSDTLEVRVGFSAYEVRPWTDAGLLALHRLMLRTAAGRGDVLAILGLPERYRWSDALLHAQSLRSSNSASLSVDEPPPLGEDEWRALSHGALQHPWLHTRRVDDVIACPPDGAVAGQLAARALARGAWIAVANLALKDVVAVGLPASDDDRQALLDAQVNPVVASPAGFVLGSAETLRLDADWRAVNVRRLMCLLRRAALKRGAQYVFEPNGDTLRRTVERAFEALLADLNGRGAFSGRNADEAYRVELGDELNTPSARDAGQFRVDLKVAPALPLTFLTVRLARQGARLVAQELR